MRNGWRRLDKGIHIDSLSPNRQRNFSSVLVLQAKDNSHDSRTTSPRSSYLYSLVPCNRTINVLTSVENFLKSHCTNMAQIPLPTNPTALAKALFEEHLCWKLSSIQAAQSVGGLDVVSQRFSDLWRDLSSPTPPKPVSPPALEQLSLKPRSCRSLPQTLDASSDPDPRFARSGSAHLIEAEIIPGNPKMRRNTDRGEEVFEGTGSSDRPKSPSEIARDKISAKDWKRKVEDREGDWDSDESGKKEGVKE
ncbi:hypothetical protein ACMFMG_002099 [Clarireedia jacksonii]